MRKAWSPEDTGVHDSSLWTPLRAFSHVCCSTRLFPVDRQEKTGEYPLYCGLGLVSELLSPATAASTPSIPFSHPGSPLFFSRLFTLLPRLPRLLPPFLSFRWAGSFLSSIPTQEEENAPSISGAVWDENALRLHHWWEQKEERRNIWKGGGRAGRDGPTDGRKTGEHGEGVFRETQKQDQQQH